jgi:hypothetical protein
MCGTINMSRIASAEKPWAILRHGDPAVVSGREAAARRSLAPAIAARLIGIQIRAQTT